MDGRRTIGRMAGFGCGLAIVAVVLLAGIGLRGGLGVVSWVFDLRRAEELRIDATFAGPVRVGETATLVLTMQHDADGPLVGMLYVDLTRALYESFDFVASDPEALYAFDGDVRRRHRLAYELDLAPGATEYRVTLSPHTAVRADGGVVYYRTTDRRPAGPEAVVPVLVVE